MKKIMVLYSIPEDVFYKTDIPGEETGVQFFDYMQDADRFKWQCTSYGGLSQVYEWNVHKHRFEFVYE